MSTLLLQAYKVYHAWKSRKKLKVQEVQEKTMRSLYNTATIEIEYLQEQLVKVNFSVVIVTCTL